LNVVRKWDKLVIVSSQLGHGLSLDPSYKKKFLL
jgi:hypothetical protein